MIHWTRISPGGPLPRAGVPVLVWYRDEAWSAQRGIIPARRSPTRQDVDIWTIQRLNGRGILRGIAILDATHWGRIDINQPTSIN